MTRKLNNNLRGDVRLGTAALTHQEVAAILKCSPQAIQQSERNAFRKIRATIKREAEAAGVSERDWLWGEE